MDKKKVLHILFSTLLPLALYLVLFQPFGHGRVTELTINTMGACKAIAIALLQLAATIFTALLFNNISLSDTGLFSFNLKSLAHIVLGSVFIALIYLGSCIILSFVFGVEGIQDTLSVKLEAPVWLLAVMMLAVGYCEEFFFRFYLVETIGSVLGKKAAILLSAVFFALGHLYQGYLAVIIIFFLGLSFQWIYSKYKSIHVNGIVHALFDVISVLAKGV
ncbi:MAG: CPBP family intramembrane metalloprotease [Spirochaetales bacterium]|nr:CPBP family intramembrane metalloprotease [Spirochaetales bacterium]